jgi:hypothetical protein
MPEQVSVPRRRSKGWGVPVGIGALVLALGAFSWLLLQAQALPDGPAPVVWDKTPCAHCRMHVGEPAFAAQLQLKDGRVLDFDDPGCLFLWLDGHPHDAAPSAVHAMYFHHKSEDRWLPRAQVGFVPMSPSPMGFGLAAVDASTAGALGLPDAIARVRGTPQHGGAP